MSQILHILKKDIRCFRLEIALVLLSAVFSVHNAIPRRSTGPIIFESSGDIQKGFSVLFWIAGTLLIGRVIHAEAIPGNKLYWLTRPYRWKSLLAEKLLFLFLFVGLPPAIVMLVSLEGAGFPLREFLPSLLLRELMIFAVWIVPVAALAAVTESLASFLVGLLFVGAVSTPIPGLLGNVPTQPFPSPILWIPASLLALILICGAVAVLHIQYKQRRTVLGRACVATSVIVGVVVATFTPFALGMQIQSLFSHVRIDHSSMVLALENEMFSGDQGHHGFSLDLKGVPPGLDARADALVGEVVGSDGKAADFSNRNSLLTSLGPAGTPRIHANMKDSDIASLRGKPVTVRGSVYITLFAAPQPWRLVPSETVVDGVHCRRNRNAFSFSGHTGNAYTFTCRAMLDSPRGTLSIRVVRDGYSETLGILGSGSYAPLPSLGLSPYEELWLGAGIFSLPERQSQPPVIEFRYTEPVSHFWLNFDIPVEHFLD